MNRSDAAFDVLDVIQSCLPDFCSYVLFRSRGVPPAECDSIAAYWGSRRSSPEIDCEGLSPCSLIIKQDLDIAITKCCAEPDAGGDRGEFDFAAEDAESVCFERDLQIIEDCLECHDWTQFGIDHAVQSVTLRSVDRDNNTAGGCFSAYLRLELVYTKCC